MDPETVDTILRKTRETWSISNNVEITLEANPTSVEAGKFADFKEAGINRVSIGIQALNDSDLRRLGRLHSVKEAKAAFETAAGLFERINFDLIYARQDQSITDWECELKEALSMGSSHISLYQLTIENGTAFGDRLAKGGLVGLPIEDLAADLFQVTQELTAKVGLCAYEVSNHAKSGSESRHNLIYWQGGDYVGIGPGAHGRLTVDEIRYETEMPKIPNDWLLAVSENGNGEIPRHAQSAIEQANEYLMMGLRLTGGIDIPRYEKIAKSSIDYNTLDNLAEIGMVKVDEQTLATTQKGRPILNAIIRELLKV